MQKEFEQAWDMLPSHDRLVKSSSDSIGPAPIDSIKHVLRLIHSHCNFDCTLICLPTDSSGLAAIAGVGKNAGQVVTKFHISGLKQNLFSEIMARHSDTFIDDVGSPMYSSLIPNWYYEVVGARSFVILPLMRGGKLLGIIYGGYLKPQTHAPSGLAEGNMLEWRERLIHALKSDTDDFTLNPPDPFLVLVYRGNSFIVDSKRSSIRIGRGERADIVMYDRRTSRKHAMIVRRDNEYIFIDHSHHGSYIFIEGEGEIHVRHGELLLHGCGCICLGFPYNKGSAEIIDFSFQHY